MKVFLPQGGLEGSVLRYHCGPGKYPFPVSQRHCAADGEWSAMRVANGRPVSVATCKGNVLNDDESVSNNIFMLHSLPHISISKVFFHLFLLFNPLLTPRTLFPSSSLSLSQICCVQLSSSWTMETSGPGISGFVLGLCRASPATKGSLFLGQHRGTAPSLGSGPEPLLSVTTMVREEYMVRK